MKNIFKRKQSVKKDIIKNLEDEKLALIDALNGMQIEDEWYDDTLDKLERINKILNTKQDIKESKKVDPVIIATLISTAGFIGVALASMKYEDDGNIIQHTVGKNALNKLGK